LSYDYGSTPTPTPVHADKIIQLIAESSRRKDFRYRTLFGNNSLPFVTYQIERLTPLMALVSPARRRTLENVYEMLTMVLLSTTSIDGKMMNLLTETKIRQTMVESSDKRKGGGGLDALFGGGKK
jgi:hypothetical protein